MSANDASTKASSGAGASADPDKGVLNSSIFDLMLIEMVPMAQRLAEELYVREQQSHRRLGAKKDAENKLDEEEAREIVFYRLEALGYRVGLGLVESLTMNMPLPSRTSPLDTIKFLCKELWTAVFKKQIDNLKTNHRGVFVLTDNRFEPLKRCSMEAGKAEEARMRATPFLHFPAGIIRGALSSLGIEATVRAEIAGNFGLPAAVFQITTAGAK